ncbi:hypothetical protein NDU88_000722, partial [Pleurodeles waltl]
AGRVRCPPHLWMSPHAPVLQAGGVRRAPHLWKSPPRSSATGRWGMGYAVHLSCGRLPRIPAHALSGPLHRSARGGRGCPTDHISQAWQVCLR